MAEGEFDYHYNSVNGLVYKCYWHNLTLREFMLDEETSLPVSEEECLRCSLENCLKCTNYLPSTKTYSEKEHKNKIKFS